MLQDKYKGLESHGHKYAHISAADWDYLPDNTKYEKIIEYLLAVLASK